MQHATEIEHLTEENTTLRSRLHDVSHSPLSDTEKQQLLLEPTQRQHNSAPASFAASSVSQYSPLTLHVINIILNYRKLWKDRQMDPVMRQTTRHLHHAQPQIGINIPVVV